MREVFLLMKYNLTTLKIYSKQGRKFKFFCQIGLKYRKIVFKYWKYILNTLKSVSKYVCFGKGGLSVTCSLSSFKAVLYGYYKQDLVGSYIPDDRRSFKSICSTFNAAHNLGRSITCCFYIFLVICVLGTQ